MKALKSMKKFSILTVVIFSLLFFVTSVEAKVLPQAAKSGPKQTAGISVSPGVRSDRKALIVNFANLQNAKAVSYLLTYKQVSSSGSKTNFQEEGARGDLNLIGSSNQTSELLFGTCSKNVCKYHTNIKDAKLEVSYTTKIGKKYLKRYKIKV